MHQFLSQNSFFINNLSLNSSSVNFLFEIPEFFELLDSLEKLSLFELLMISERICYILSIPSTTGAYILGILSSSFKLMFYADALLWNFISLGLICLFYDISYEPSCSFNSIYSWSICICSLISKQDFSTCYISMSCILGGFINWADSFGPNKDSIFSTVFLEYFVEGFFFYISFGILLVF